MSHQTYARDCNWGFGADVRDLCAEIGDEDRDRWRKLRADSVLCGQSISRCVEEV